MSELASHSVTHRVITSHDFDDHEQFARLLDKVTLERGFRCGSYKERCLRRRIAVRMRAKAVHTFDDYAQALDDDPSEYDRLLDALTINVTKLFRNWDSWHALAEQSIPRLWTATDGALRAWSAGAASGEEAYSLAALIHRHAAATGAIDKLSRTKVLGTDIDRASLAAAVRGVYTEPAFADTPPELRSRYFADGSPSPVTDDLRSFTSFERRDLLLETPPPGPWHLIVCRNVIIYFDRDTQEALFERFHDALAPGGILFLGKVETLLGSVRQRFVAVDQRERIFRRL